MTMAEEHRNMGWATAEELACDAMKRDELGRIRDDQGRYVCGISGRTHLHYLRPWPDYDPETGTVRIVWLDDEAIRWLGSGVLDEAADKARNAGARYVGDLLTGALRVIGSALAAALGKRLGL